MTHEIIVSPETPDAEEFVTWLESQGHSAKVGNSSGNYVDGEWTTDETANEIMRHLWDAYCKSI